MKNKTKFFAYIILIMLLVYKINLGQTGRKLLSGDFDRVIDKAVELDVSSGAVLVAERGEIIYQRAFGEANKNFGIKNNLQTKFNIASITKTFTAVAIMMLDQKGVLSINDPVVKYLPDFPLGNKITIYHLLTHSSGLGDYEENREYIANQFSIKDISGILPFIYKEKLLFDEPGLKESYSNSGAVVLGAVIEKVTGIKYSEFLDRNILKPLKMNNTAFKHPAEVTANRAEGYIKKLSGEFRITSFDVNPPSSATGLLTTAGDLFLFDQALYGNTLIDARHRDLMFIHSKVSENRGCIWELYKRKGYPDANGHSGHQYGFTSQFMRYPKDSLTIIVLSNYDAGARIFSQIENILLGKEYSMPVRPAEEYIYSLLKESDYDSAKIKIDILLEKKEIIIRSENVLNNAGYSLIEDGDVKTAIKIFIMNSALYSESANVYDSLAEAYMLDGNRNLAIENYRKTLKLNPDNKTAQWNLEKLLKVK